MSLSAKQLAFAWINSKLDPSRINPEDEELQILNGGKPIKEATIEGAKKFIMDELAKLKASKYQPYVEKYCNTGAKHADGLEESSTTT